MLGMKRGILISIIAGVVLALVAGFFILTNNGNNSYNNMNPDEMVDCSKIQNPSCFVNRMISCLPVTAKLTGTDGSDIDITIFGYVNETCHFQRKINNVMNLNCYFPNGTLTWDLIDQTFGNEKGLQAVVDSSCGL